MAISVTNSQIRDLLNRPRGLTEGTITEYVTIRTNQVVKMARGAEYNVSLFAVSDAEKSDAIKYLVCCDCLRVLIDTAPMYVPDNKFRQQDIRLRTQLETMQKQADSILALISEKGGTAFYTTKSSTRIE
tara:strand:- start:1663 stop:2052 length:390 start_codon:yes stop_codon:yes gene_type:complete